MRLESCRNCGSTISVLKLCKVCNQPTKLRCENCLKYVDDPIHFRCEFLLAECN